MTTTTEPVGRESGHERLASHNKHLEEHRKALEENKRWLRQQRESSSLRLDTSADTMNSSSINNNSANLSSGSSLSPAPSASMSATFGIGGGDDAEHRQSSSSSSNAQDALTAGLSPSRRAFSPSITAYSRGLRRDEPVEDILLEARDRYQQRQADKRADQLRLELVDFTGRPAINPSSQALVRDDMPIEERLTKQYFEREARLERERERARQQQEETLSSARPEITPRAAAVTRREDVVTFTAQWELARKQRLLQETERQRQREEEEIRDHPEISERSEKLVRQQSRDADIATHLSQVMSERRQKIQERLDREWQEQNYGTPRITEFAVRMQRDGVVHDRLFDESFVQADRTDAARSRVEQLFLGAGSFTPRINRHPSLDAKYGGQRRIEDILLDHHDMRRREFEERVERERQAEEMQRTPKIDANSARLAAKLPSSRDRLLTLSTSFSSSSSGGAPKSRQSLSPDDSSVSSGGGNGFHIDHRNRDQVRLSPSSAECTFKPRINPTSARLDRRHSTRSADRCSQLYESRQRHEAYLNELRKEYEDQEIRDCTFAPDTTLGGDRRRKSLPDGGAGGNGTGNGSGAAGSKSRGGESSSSGAPGGAGVVSSGSSSSSSSLADRMSQWKDTRDRRVAEQRRLQDERDQQECSFRPSVSLARKNSLLDSSVVGAGGSIRPLSAGTNPQQVIGVEEFLQRQREARDRRESAAAAAAGSGQKWKNELTRPLSPKLGIRRDRIRSLEKPVSLTPRTESPRVKSDQARQYMQSHQSILSHVAVPGDAVLARGSFSQHGTVNILLDASLGQDHVVPPSRSVIEEAQYAVDTNPPSEEWLQKSREKRQREMQNLS